MEMDPGSCQDASDTQARFAPLRDRAFSFQCGRTEIRSDQLPLPPVAGLATFIRSGESIFVVEPSEVSGRPIRKWIRS